MKRGKMINILEDILEYRKKNFSHNEFSLTTKKRGVVKEKWAIINIVDNV